jgi:AcrR family transcriptional regulator
MDDRVGKRAGYHHGDLRQAMIEAAEVVLAEKGVGGFTLRECAEMMRRRRRRIISAISSAF